MAAPNTFAGEALDRAGPHRRDEAWLAARLADPATRVVVASEAGVVVDDERPRLLSVDELPGGLELVLLGVDGDGRAIFAAEVLISASLSSSPCAASFSLDAP